MPKSKLNVTLVAASILRESELPGFENISDFASESFNLAIASIKASIQAKPDLAPRVRVDLADFDVSWDRKNLGEAEAQGVVALAPDVVGLSCYCWSLDTLLDLAQRLRAHLPQALILLGGPSAGPAAAPILRTHQHVDAVVRGEGEDAFVALLRARLRGEPLASVPGLSFRGEDDDVVENPLPSRPVDLHTLPSVYRTGVMHPTGASLFLETSRGCRFRCRFCSWMGGSRHLRYVPIDQVEADLRWALDRGVRGIKLADTAINFHTERLKELSDTLHRVDPEGRLRLTYFLKPELLTEEQIDILESIPSEEVIIGVESLTPAARRAAGKPPFEPEAFERQMAWLSRVGPVTASFILGLPGETQAGLDHTLDWMIRFDEAHPGWLHVICLFWLAVLPGAALHDKRHALGLRFMPRETPYLLESHEHPPDHLLCMARRSIERHYGHPKLRVEYFHKEYLMQDAPQEDRKVTIPRVARDERRCVVLAGEVDPEWERSFRIRPYNLEVAWLKAFVETDEALRRAWRLELVHGTRRREHLNGIFAGIEARRPAWVVWSLRAAPSQRFAALLAALRERTGATVVLQGASTLEAAERFLEAAPAASMATVGEAERTLAGLLGGEPRPPGLVFSRDGRTFDTGPPDMVQDLDTIPSPFQWGFVQRSGAAIAMQLGRPGPPPRTFSAERVYRDLRWAIEQRHDHVVWLDDALPNDPAMLHAFATAVRRADPQGKLRHTYRIDRHHSAESLAALKGLPAQTTVAPSLADVADALRPLERPGALTGWKLVRIETRADEVRAHLQWQRSATVVLCLQPRSSTRQVHATFEVAGPRPPDEALERLTRAITRLLKRRTTTRRSCE